jgi:oligoendopeptidase F
MMKIEQPIQQRKWANGKLLILCMLLAATPLAASGPVIPDYSTTERKDIPVEYTWSIEDIYPSCSEWRQDKAQLLEMMGRIQEASQGWTSSAQKVLRVMRLRDELYTKLFRIFSYALHQNNTDMGNAEFAAMKGEAQTLLADLAAKFAFKTSDILKLGEAAVSGYLQSEPGLKPYRFEFENILREGKHVLPREQEEIVRSSALFSDNFRTASGILNNLEMPAPEITLSNGSKMLLNRANYNKIRESKNRVDRELAIKVFWENHSQFLNTFAALLDGEMKRHLFLAKARKYADCLDSALSEDNIDPPVYHALIEHGRANLEPLHRYWALKKKLLGVETLKHSDRYVSAVDRVEKRYSYEEAQKILLEAFRPLGSEYAQAVREAFRERWIDIYPNKGKQAGGYSASAFGLHPYIKLNFDGSYAALSDLAHELGHAMHSHFSCTNQPFANAECPTFLAEIASTFNENLLIQYLLKTENDDRFKLYILDQFLQQIQTYVYLQAQLSEYELAMHREVEAGRTLTAEWLSKKHLELSRFYNGHKKGIMEVEEISQGEWAAIPHFFRNYYLYTYGTGKIASMALTERVLNGKRQERESYLALLKAGGSDYPLSILKASGIDMNNAETYRRAFAHISMLVSTTEKLSDALLSEKGNVQKKSH